MNKKLSNIAAFLSLLCFLQVSSAAAQTYEVIIYNPTNGFSDTEGEGLNGQQRVGAGRIAGSTLPDNTHAFLWTGSSITPLDLHPANFTYSRAYDTDGTRQVGYTELNLFPQIQRRAAIWNGTANSFVALSTGFSEAFAIGGDQQVGYVDGSFTCSECGTITNINAALWRGSPGTFVNLHPLGIGSEESYAYDTDGTQQVGEGYFPGTFRNYRALLWSGTRQSVVDLSPPNNSFNRTTANAVRNGVQVGYGVNISTQTIRALLWRGTAASVVNLGVGIARDTNGASHVGETDGGNNRTNAFRWDGDSGAGFNLHALLPAGVYENSSAAAIDQDGNIIGSAQLPNGRLVGVLWRAASSGAKKDFDFDGDGKADVSVYRNGTWYLQKSRDGFAAVAFGASSDKIVPADYDGDGKTDVAVYRGGAWYVLRSLDNAFSAVSFGSAEDIPRPADFDGDGKADYAVFRPSNGTWYLQKSSLGLSGTAFGQNGDFPMPADYDGDRKADICVFRPSNGIWYRLNSSNGQFTAVSFGQNGDVPTRGDFDGDGRADTAVFRPSNGFWYLNRSTQGLTSVSFGRNGDVPVPADFDGDGKTDIAVFRNGIWYVQQSANGFVGVQFGSDGDVPIQTLP